MLNHGICKAIEATKFDLIEVLGLPALFTNERLYEKDIPQGLYLYHLRGSDDGDAFCTIEPYVGVNHSGSVITSEPIDFEGKTYIAFTDDSSPNFIGEHLTIQEYLSGNFTLDTDQGMGGM